MSSNARDIDVYAIGNALVDLQVRVDDDFLRRVAAPKGEMRLVEASDQTRLLEALQDHPVNRCSGGSAANTIVGLAELGGVSAYCGKVADDELGGFYRDDLARLGIRLHAEHGAGQTGTSLVMITPDAQRTMMTHLGISSNLGPEDVDAAVIRRARYVYIEGYLFTGESTRAAALRAIDTAKAEGAKVALTVSDPFVIGLCRDLFWDLIKGPVDLLFCNEQEAAALTGTPDPVESAREIHRHAANVALTLGAKGSLLMHDHELYPVEGETVQAVDTTGAGDMYAAGLLYGLTHGLSWSQAGHLASHAAARIVERLGARLPGPFSQADIARLTDGR